VANSNSKNCFARAPLTVLLASAALLLGCCAAITRAHPVQAASNAGFEAADFAGTWNWMFEGKVFATMILERKGDQFTGSITNGTIELDSEGKIASATPAPGSAEIVKTSLEGETLHVVSKDGDETTEWLVTLKSPQEAEVRVTGPGVPANFPPIHAEKVK